LRHRQEIGGVFLGQGDVLISPSSRLLTPEAHGAGSRAGLFLQGTGRTGTAQFGTQFFDREGAEGPVGSDVDGGHCIPNLDKPEPKKV